jgi:hypothetical protein
LIVVLNNNNVAITHLYFPMACFIIKPNLLTGSFNL